MPLPSDVDATSPKYLRDKYAIVGVGETTYMRGSGKIRRYEVRTGVAFREVGNYGGRHYLS